MRNSVSVGLVALIGACDCGSTAATGEDAGETFVDTGFPNLDVPRDAAGGTNPRFESELWYSVDNALFRFVIDESSGLATDLLRSDFNMPLERGQNAITMLEDGSLLLARLARSDDQSYFYHLADPPRDGSMAVVTPLGIMPGEIMVEGLYSDCEGRIYAMDTGVDDGSSEGNRLLRFTGNLLGGDFTFAVVSDLSSADVADIDDLGPGLDGNRITDNPGLAIDTGDIYNFNYETGSGTLAGSGGTWGIHVLGGDLFRDGRSRLYIMSRDAELYEANPTTLQLMGPLEVGPDTDSESPPGWSGLAGPLTECETGFVLI